MEPEAVQAQVDQVFAEPPFTQTLDLAAFWRWLKRFYDNTLSDLYFSDPVMFWATVVGLVLVLALLVWHLSSSLSSVLRVLRRQGAANLDETPAPPPPNLGAAERALASGDHRLAVELAWSTVVARHGSESALTPRQWARRAARSLPESDVMRLLYLHEAACYAGVPPSSEQARAALEAAGALL